MRLCLKHNTITDTVVSNATARITPTIVTTVLFLLSFMLLLVNRFNSFIAICLHSLIHDSKIRDAQIHYAHRSLSLDPSVFNSYYPVCTLGYLKIMSDHNYCLVVLSVGFSKQLHYLIAGF